MSDGQAARPKRVIVVAYARNRVIGRDNGLPWQLPSDLKHFKGATMGRPMIMGRKTFLSIGKALPGRTSIVVTRDPSFHAEGSLVAPSIEAAIRIAEDVAQRDAVDEIMITGGGEIYAQALPFVDRIIATEIALDVEGHARFPTLDPADWLEMSRTAVARGPRDDADYEIVIYDRLPSGVR
jgi:dihydrofolate reductase